MEIQLKSKGLWALYQAAKAFEFLVKRADKLNADAKRGLTFLASLSVKSIELKRDADENDREQFIDLLVENLTSVEMELIFAALAKKATAKIKDPERRDAATRLIMLSNDYAALLVDKDPNNGQQIVDFSKNYIRSVAGKEHALLLLDPAFDAIAKSNPELAGFLEAIIRDLLEGVK